MFAVKLYDLGYEKEAVGYYPDALKTDCEYEQIGSDKIKYSEYQTQEFKDRDNIERAVRRAKTKVRRTAEKYNLAYMWTLTFANRLTTIYNPANKKTFTYDVGTWEGAWKVFAIFIRRCQKQGLKFNYIVTAEIQEKREEKTGEKVYHFHLATDIYIPQNEKMRRKFNYSHQYKDRFDYALNDFWTFGHTKATERKGMRMCTNYMVKYISKCFEELDLKGKQRYRISEGMEITFDILTFKDHLEYLEWCQNDMTMKADRRGNPVSKYFVLGSSLEIWWNKFIS